MHTIFFKPFSLIFQNISNNVYFKRLSKYSKILLTQMCSEEMKRISFRITKILSSFTNSSPLYINYFFRSESIHYCI